MKECAFLVPICSNNLPDGALNEQLFMKVFLKSLLLSLPDFKIRIYAGYDHDDKIYSDIDHRKIIQNKINTIDNLHITWLPVPEEFKGKPTWIWNELSKHAIIEGYEYMFACGDDIRFPKQKEWLGVMIKSLKKTNDIGIAGGDSGNPELPLTQFLFHKNHYDMFGFIFPEQIHAWFCDNWIQEVYPKKYVHYFEQYKLLNEGGPPRYEPKNDKNICNLLVKRYKSTIIRKINF